MAKSREPYQAYKERQAEISRERSQAGREIGPLPRVKNPKRKKRCATSFRLFCETYFPNRFPLAWSRDHLAAIERLERCIHAGGQYGYAMARGSGKTTLAECGAMYATFNGHRRFVMLIGATESHASSLLDSIKAEVETNDLLAEDYPEVCHPVRAMEGIHNRANGQTLDDKRTRIKWTADNIVLPTVPKKASSGAVIRVAGITGAIRGAKHVGTDGKPIRPDLAILDDPQTDESARSPSQNATREGVISKAVLGLAGPKKKIAAVMPCTVIVPGDLADRFLDRERHPAWQGERSAMVVSWPTDQALWDQYAELRRQSLRAGNEGREATEFYAANREAMDAGAEVSWAERFNDDELSAIQHAWNLRIDRGERAFFAEYQNDPRKDEVAGQVEDLDADSLSRRVNRVTRGVVPSECARLTAMIDVGGGVLFWCVCGWSESFAGSVIDYGTFPRQNRSYFDASDARPSLADFFKDHDETARVYAGLKATVDAVVGRSYPRHGGGDLRVERCLIDSGWLTDTVHQFCRQSVYAPLLLPSKGYGIGASGSPMSAWQKKHSDERAGDNWRLVPVTGGGRGRLVLYDSNHWKTFVAQRLTSPEGSAGRLLLFGDGTGEHQLFADHLTAEYRVQTEGRGRKVEEWKARPERRDNHWFDTLVGCAVAASLLGVKWDSGVAAGEPPRATEPRKRVRLSDKFREKHGGR